MRQRFTEINIKNSDTPAIPVGAEASNITLSDGSILEQALGDINFQENGSIIDQIEKMKQNDILQYAPIEKPYFKRSLHLRRFSENNTDIVSQLAISNSTKTAKGITASYSNGTWTFNGTVTGDSSGIINLYGDADVSVSITEAGTYSVYVENQDALIGTSGQGKTCLQFFWYHNEATSQNDSRRNGFIFYKGNNNPTTFTIPKDYHLIRISLYMAVEAKGISLVNRKLKFTLKKVSNTQNTYNTVFDIQRDPFTNAWKTTVAENFTVAKGSQGEARSSLGTIYNSQWSGDFAIKGFINVNKENNKDGILIEDGGIGFQTKANLSDYGSSNNVSQQWSTSASIRQKTPFFIGPKFISNGTSHLYYGSKNSHRFYIGQEPSDDNTILIASKDLTTISNRLQVNSIRSSVIPQYIYLADRKTLENIINDNTNYPSGIPFVFKTSAKMSSYLINSGDPNKTAAIMLGIGYKTNSGTTRRFVGYFALQNLFFIDYSWTSNVTNSRTLTVKRMTQNVSITSSFTKKGAPGSSGW